MSGFRVIPKKQHERLKELERISQVVSRFDFSELLDVLCVKLSFEEEHGKKMLIELSRFLTLKALDLDLDATSLSPSGLVDQAWHEFMLLPKIYYQFCDKILPSQVKVPRLIDHNPLGADDDDREDRYKRTLRRYRKAFGIEPPPLFWEEPMEEEDEDEQDDEEEEGTGENVRKRARLDKPNEQIQHHACQKPDCNCGSDPRPALTDHIEGVTVQVFVKRLTMPHSVPFNVDLSSTTVKQLKAQYHIKVGTNCKYFTLLFNGRQLEDDHLLSDYNIQNESSVYLKLELRGC